MPPPPHPPFPHPPRLIIYHQTHHNPTTSLPISLLPLLPTPSRPSPITHLILAAIHLNATPGSITLNDHPPTHARNSTLWSELRLLQRAGVKILAMLGGAAKGTFARLDTPDEAEFERYYTPLRDMLRAPVLDFNFAFDGIDLDVEEPLSLTGIIRLIDRLKADFSAQFIITLAPVAAAMQGKEHLSGFDYEVLEMMRGESVEWYNVQFYNGWGGLEDFGGVDEVLGRGWGMGRVVVGVLTGEGLGGGYVEWEELQKTVSVLTQFYPGLGGVMGWEYFCSRPGGIERPWEWAEGMARCLGNC
ncbi:hypothetical protein MMC21_000903 [Puttea exsequens]|nr:hypothetical protein [Puttea exsequens]